MSGPCLRKLHLKKIHWRIPLTESLLIKVARKKLKLDGKPYVTGKGKQKAGKKPMHWVDCKCRNKCGESLNIEERMNIYDNYWVFT